MTTSGTAVFDLQVQELIEEAFERAGTEMRSGYDLRSARRSLNLLAAEWANRGYNLWTVTQYAIPLVAATATYNLPADTIDTIDHVLRTISSQTDIVLRRLSLSSYAALPNKAAPGIPNQVFVDRKIVSTLTVWPVPTSTGQQIVVWYMRRMQDAGAGGGFTADIPFRFIPAFVAGLAYMIAMKRPEVQEARVERLLNEYNAQWDLAASEDRERASVFLTPGVR